MGNHLACICARSPGLSTLIKVVHAGDGRVIEYDEPIKVAELMFEFSNHFVVDSTSLHGGERVLPLSADDETKNSHAYILLPMHKLHTRLSAEELDFFATALSKSTTAKLPKHGQSKVAPLSSALHVSVGEEAEIDEKLETPSLSLAKSYSFPAGDNPQLQNLGAQRQMMRSRSWMPKLETISESSHLKE